MTGSRSTPPSLPLDGARGLARAVEHHPVDLRHGVGDPVGDARQDVVGQAGPVRGHGVLTADRPQNNGVTVGAPVTLDAHGAPPTFLPGEEAINV